MIQSNRCRVFVTRQFERWCNRAGLTEAQLCSALLEIRAGLVDAALGGGVVKKRIGLAGRGKRGGVRVLATTDHRQRWFFVAGFRKNERDNVTTRELVALQGFAAHFLALSDDALDVLVARGALKEICHGEEEGEAGQPDPRGGTRGGPRSARRWLH